jgi:signal transduction histidine kinase/BarA-like signal transduction histidine kinase
MRLRAFDRDRHAAQRIKRRSRRRGSKIADEAMRLGAIVKTQQEIVQAKLDPAHVMQLIVENVQGLTAADGTIVEIVDGDSLIYRAASGSAAQWLGQKVSLTTSLSGRCVTLNEALLCNNTREDAAQLKSEFLANMSHEIRRPLNGIIGMTDLLLQTPLSAEQNRYAKIVQDSGMGLLTIINDILDFSKIEAGKLLFESQDFCLQTVVTSQIELLQGRAQEKNLVLQPLIDRSIPAVLRGDAGRISQILLNLLGNAIKFTASGSVTVQATLVALALAAEQAEVRFSVADDNAVNQLLAVTMLKSLGHTVHCVGNGHEALEALRQAPYDLVLMDCQMPEMDGYEATRTIRDQERVTGQHLLVVALTANAMKEDAERCLQAGMDDVLTKPIKKARLADTVAQWLSSQKSDQKPHALAPCGVPSIK